MKHDWEYKKLGEVALITMGQSPSSDTYNDKVGLPFFQGNADFGKEHPNVRIYCSAPVKIAQKNDILISVRAPIGAINIADRECCIGRGLASVRNGINIDSRFILYLLTAKKHILIEQGTGSTFKSIGKDALNNFSIPVPPLPTQQSIVSELDSLSQIIADCKETIKDYDALEQSIFYDMFGDPVKNDKGWKVKKLEDICSNIVDCPHSTPTKSDVPTIYPCIRTSELRNGEIYWDSMQYVEEEEYKNRIVRLQPQKDDIVFGREGSIGGAVILPEGYQFCLGQRTMLLRVDESIIHSIFLHRVILSDWVKNQIMDKNVASTVAHVNVKDVKAFLIPVPPLPLQQQFASKIEAIEQMKSETKKALQEAETLFQARMDYWFN